jgi:hypothetical protein
MASIAEDQERTERARAELSLEPTHGTTVSKVPGGAREHGGLVDAVKTSTDIGQTSIDFTLRAGRTEVGTEHAVRSTAA